MLQLGANISILIICLAFLFFWVSKNWFFLKPKGYEITLVFKSRVSCNPIYSPSKISGGLSPLSAEPNEEKNYKMHPAKGNTFINSVSKYLEEKHIFRISKQ